MTNAELKRHDHRRYLFLLAVAAAQSCVIAGVDRMTLHNWPQGWLWFGGSLVPSAFAYWLYLDTRTIAGELRQTRGSQNRDLSSVVTWVLLGVGISALGAYYVIAGFRNGGLQLIGAFMIGLAMLFLGSYFSVAAVTTILRRMRSH
ncbi:MAG: hypothetical protein ACRDZ8_13920 [Acidimicrobiales bacterium]